MQKMITYDCLLDGTKKVIVRKVGVFTSTTHCLEALLSVMVLSTDCLSSWFPMSLAMWLASAKLHELIG